MRVQRETTNEKAAENTATCGKSTSTAIPETAKPSSSWNKKRQDLGGEWWMWKEMTFEQGQNFHISYWSQRVK